MLTTAALYVSCIISTYSLWVSFFPSMSTALAARATYPDLLALLQSPLVTQCAHGKIAKIKV